MKFAPANIQTIRFSWFDNATGFYLSRTVLAFAIKYLFCTYESTPSGLYDPLRSSSGTVKSCLPAEVYLMRDAEYPPGEVNYMVHSPTS